MLLRSGVAEMKCAKVTSGVSMWTLVLGRCWVFSKVNMSQIKHRSTRFVSTNPLGCVFDLCWVTSDSSGPVLITAGVLKAWLSLCRRACGCSPCWSHCIMRLSSELWGRGCTGCSCNAPVKAEANSSAFQLWILPLRWSAPGLVSRADAAARQVSPCFHECVPLWKVEVENEISDL